MNKPIHEDHTYDLSSAGKMSQLFEHNKRLKKLLGQHQRFIKNSKAKVKRLKKKVSDLPTLLKKLENLDFISKNFKDSIEHNFHPVMQHLLSRQLKKQNKEHIGKEFEKEVKSFSIALNFYSPKAYTFLRRYMPLPHPSTLKRWISVIKCAPGPIEESFHFLQMKTNSGRHSIICALIFDEMSIHSAAEYEKGEFIGGVDIGHGQINDNSTLATEALFFLLVPLMETFKLPLGYALINGLNSLDKSKLLLEYLERLHEVGVQVKSITFDGTATNFSMVKNLGACLQLGANFKNYFCFEDKKVYIFLDACHMLKLARNMLDSKKVIRNGGNKKVS